MLSSRITLTCSLSSRPVECATQMRRVPILGGRTIFAPSSRALSISPNRTGSSACPSCYRACSFATSTHSPCSSALGPRDISVPARGIAATSHRQASSQSISRAHFHSASPRMSLQQESCVPCRKGAPKLSQQEITEMLRELEGHSSGSLWQISTRQAGEQPTSSIPALEKSFVFKNFRTALAFTNAVGEMAEREKHHPEMLLEWGRVRVAWWTHAIEGVSTPMYSL
jgi:4a-hydroxytetrahydrobiopterin dehydratase